MKQTSRPRLPTIRCPHCNARAMVRTSEQLSPTYRESRLVCEDETCGHAFVIGVSVIRTVVPSRRPNPEIQLPFANPNQTGPRPRPLPANDDNRQPANDDNPPPVEAVDTMTS